MANQLVTQISDRSILVAKFADLSLLLSSFERTPFIGAAVTIARSIISITLVRPYCLSSNSSVSNFF
jgi:hypothetical protein